MKMKRQLWNLRFGNKAFIFSLDVVIAIFVVMSLLVVSTFYVTKAGGESVSKLQTIRLGYDMLALLDYDNSLDTLSAGVIETELNRILPINYHIKIRANCKDRDDVVVETTDAFPNNRFIGSGRRVFISNAGDYCIADFNIWLK